MELYKNRVKKDIMKKYYKVSIIMLIIIIGIINLTIKNKKENKYILKVSDLKAEMGIIGDESLYDIVDVGNNTEALSIKEDIKFKVSLAGMIEERKPELFEVDNIINEIKFREKGVYINKKSRKQFIEFIKQFTNGSYEIDKEEYIKLINNNNININENDKKIIEQLEKKQLLIIDFSNFCYIVDEVTGEVVDYPFEQMDPYQISQTYNCENKTIMFVTTNCKQKLRNEEIFSEIF